MHFIFPKNYNFRPKLFGFIEYTTAVIDIIIALFLYGFVNLIFTSINIKIYIFISLFLPIFLVSIFGINNEPLIYVLFYLLKYLLSSKLYLFKKY